MRTAAVLLLLVLVQSPAPHQPPRFRAGIDVVELDVSVLDRDRRPVRGLTAPDFTVLEDGQPQEIVAFEEVDLPDPEATAASWMREVAPDVRSNDFTAGRLLVLVLDDATMPGNPATVATAKKIAREVIAQLGPQDLAAVLFTLDNSNSQDFTTEHARLTRAVDQVKFGFVRPPFAPAGSVAPSRAGSENKLWYQYSIQTVRRAAGYLRDAPQRRKTLIYISVGVPVEFVPASAVNLGLDSDLPHEMQRAFEEAIRSNVTIYAINPAGLEVNEDRLKREFLQSMSENTGGYAVVNTNAPESEVASVMEESGSYYLLGYQSTNQKPDGKLRRLQVRVNRPGVSVRSRRGYYATRRAPDTSAETSTPVADSPKDAIGGVLPKGDLPMHVAVAPFAISGKREAALAIVTRFDQPAVSEPSQQKVEVLTALFDTEGKSKGGKTHSVDLTLRPGDASSQYEVLSRIDVRPGRYLLRVGAHAKELAKSGSVYYDVDVPDFSKAALSLSGVILSATPALKGGGDVLATLIPLVPTTRREFGREDAVTAFARVYQGGRKSPSPVAVAVRVVDATDRQVFQRTDTLAATSFSTERAADYTLELPVSGFAPGEHVLRIEARAGKAIARRDVRFAIR